MARTPPRPVRPLSKPSGAIATFFARSFVGALGALSDRSRLRLGVFVGRLAYALGIRRRITLDNLRHAYPELPEPDRRRIAKGAFENMAMAAIEALAPPPTDRAALEARVQVENGDSFFADIAAGKGVLVATAHFGSWEILAEVMSLRGMPLSAVVRPLEGSLNAVIVENRRKAGVNLIAGRGAIGGALKALREGQVVAMLIDQVLPAKQGVFVPFFGRLASTTPAFSIAALRSGSPVYVVMGVRDGERLRMICEGPFPLPQEGTLEARLRQHTATVTAALERRIRAHPEQWMWLHRRWKVAPPDEQLPPGT